MIDRRAGLTVLGAALAAPCAAVSAQAQVRRLAMLLVGSESGPGSSPWPLLVHLGLGELGWVAGRNLVVAPRYADSAIDRLPALAAELVALAPDVFFTHTSSGARAVAQATATIPIVVAAAIEEVLVELAGGLARPRSNVTGSSLVSHEQHAKCLELLKQAHPAAIRVGVLVSPLATAYRDYPAALSRLIGDIALELARVEATHDADLGAAIASLGTAGVRAMLVPAYPPFNRVATRRLIIAHAGVWGIAVATTFEDDVRDGALMSFGADFRVLGRTAAAQIDKILRGARPAELPIERPSVFRLVVNLKTARALGLTLPATILLRADEVIE